jgi:putative ABC transport system ATP-binding protein
MSRILQIRDVSKAYRDGRDQRRVLEGQSFDVYAGEVVVLRGPSGSGKTTLLNIVAGLVPADTGTLHLAVDDGELALHELNEAERVRARRIHLGYVFQFFNLVPTLTVRENVLLPLELTRRFDLAPRALQRLGSLGLGDRGDDFPDQLSGGERQRVAIARALAHEPRLVLADEPTGNLDAGNAGLVADLLWREVRELNSALLLATHDVDVAGRADRVIEIGVHKRQVA